MKLNALCFQVFVYTIVNAGLETSRNTFSFVPTENDSSLKQNRLSPRSRDIINEVLHCERPNHKHLEKTLDQLVEIYEKSIKPLEELYKYNALPTDDKITAGQIKAKPMVMLLGPWSSGKTSMINYLLGSNLLRVGAEPTTSEFTVIGYGEKEKKTEGIVLVSDKTKEYSDLEQFGENFLERFTGHELPHPLLKKVTFVDTPGIIENRKQQERGYPFNKVMKWFINKSDLIFIVFDPTKLDVGIELETLFKQLKGKESQIRLILNKADSLESQELMRVYGALFWSFAPLINVTEPPRLYIGSFWPFEYKENSNKLLFKQEEVSLLQDLNSAIENRAENKVAYVRQHAIRVKIHALLVDKFLSTYHENLSFLANEQTVLYDIINYPELYGIPRNVFVINNLSPFDMPAVETYKDFFNINHLTTFRLLSSHCGYFSKCPLDNLQDAISTKLPQLLSLSSHKNDKTEL